MANRFWIGGTGTWGDGNLAHWSATDGGAGGASEPTASDAVFFTANSGSGTISLNQTLECLSLDTTGFTGTISGAAGGLLVYGPITVAPATVLAAPMGNLQLNAAGGSHNVNVAGKTIAVDVTFGGTSTPAYTLTAGLAATNQIQAAACSLDTNNQVVTGASLRSSSGATVNINGAGVNVTTLSCSGATLNLNASTPTCATFTATSSPVVNMGSAHLTCTSAFNATGATFNEGTSLITYTGTSFSYTAGETFYGVELTSTSAITIATATFDNLSRTCAGYGTLSLSGNITVNTSLTLAGGNVSSQRLLVQSNTAGTARTVTYNGASAAAFTNVDFIDITRAGTGTATITSVGDGGGNSNISFAAPVTRYWVDPGSGTPNITDNNWAATSGGATSSTNQPLLQDTCRFDANSFAAGSRSVTQNIANYRMGSIDWTGVTNAPTWTISSAILDFGSLAINTGLTLGSSSSLTLLNRGANNTIASGGQAWGRQFSQQALTGSYALSDAFSSTSSYTVSSGNFVDNGYTITVSSFNITGSNTRSGTFSGTRILTGTGTVWNAGAITGLTFSDTGIIKLTNNSASTKTFAGGGLTYRNFYNNTAGSGVVNFTGSNTFQGFIMIDGGRTQNFTAATTTTFAQLLRGAGDPTSVITIGSITAANHNLVKTGGVVNLNFMSISRSQASPSSGIFYAGANSTDGGNNSGWIFSAPPTSGTTLMMAASLF
jgi:hypothetical protein